jgi:hypothetical protein
MKSTFLPIGEHDGHTCEFEVIGSQRRPKALYVVFDGVRIARRGDPGTLHAKTWVSLEPGYTVVDEGPDNLAVYFEGHALH